MNRTLPSQKQALTPPACRLRAWACQFGQLFGRLSFEQPIFRMPSPEFPTPIAWRTALQSSMSSEYSFWSLGTVQSPIEEAAVRLDPASPIAQTPRRSFWLSPIRTSLNRMVLEVPSWTVIVATDAPKLMPNGPPDRPAAPPPNAPPSWESPSRVQLNQPAPALAA